MVSIGYNNIGGINVPYIDYGQGPGYIPVNKKIILGANVVNWAGITKTAATAGAASSGALDWLGGMVKKVPIPSFGTTLKVAAVPVVGYVGYKAATGAGAVIDNAASIFGGPFGPKPPVLDNGKPTDIPPTKKDLTIDGTTSTTTNNYYATDPGFGSTFGAGLGTGAADIGAGISGAVLPIALLTGGYLILKDYGKGKKRKK